MFLFLYIIPFGSFYILLHFNNLFKIILSALFVLYIYIIIIIYNCFISLFNELKHDQIR